MPRRQKRCGNWPAPRSVERNGQFFEVPYSLFVYGLFAYYLFANSLFANNLLTCSLFARGLFLHGLSIRIIIPLPPPLPCPK
jgi:hypothetical protein